MFRFLKGRKKDLEEKVKSLGIIEDFDPSWSIEKAARDLIQNFHDGNDYSLDNIEVRIKRSLMNYEIEIRGDASYDYRLLLHIGATTKKQDPRAIGKYGEGAKIASFMLLNRFNFKKVLFSSENWELEYSMDTLPEDESMERKKGLFAHINFLSESTEGNYIKLVTSKKEFTKVFSDALNLFIHSNNPDVQDPTLEVEGVGGFKILESEEDIPKGNFYYRKQRRHAILEEWNTLKFVNLWYNLPGLREDRDRGIVTQREIYKIVVPRIIENAETSDLIQVVYNLSDFWEVGNSNYHDPTKIYGVAGRLIEETAKELAKREVRIDFDENSYAISDNVPLSLIAGMKKAGRRICWEFMSDIGMSSVTRNLGDRVEFLHILESANVSWPFEKIVRDLFQNFYDGDNKSLEGVDINVRSKDLDYIIEITGLAEFDYRELLHIGGTSKSERTDTAGGKGEGAKVCSLQLIRDHGFSQVEFKSQDWELEYKLEPMASLGHEGEYVNDDIAGLFAFIRLNKPDAKGNCLKLVTDDKDLALAFTRAPDLFQHPGNPDFQNPTLDIPGIGGFKLLEIENDPHDMVESLSQEEGVAFSAAAHDDLVTRLAPKGNFYVAGQRIHAIEERWNTIKYVNVWVHPNNLVKIDRDRGVVSENDLYEEAVPFIIKNSETEDLTDIVKKMNKFWKIPNDSFFKTKYAYGGAGVILEEIASVLSGRKKKIEFDEIYLADSGIPGSYKKALKDKGYVICWEFMAKLGMKTSRTKLNEIFDLNSIEPTPEESAKIEILKKAGEEIGLKIKEIMLYEGEDDPFEGHYKNDACYLKRDALQGPFFKAVGFYLHEMCHEHGSDTSSEYSYALTDVLIDSIEKTARNSKTFLFLEKRWSDPLNENIKLEDTIRDERVDEGWYDVLAENYMVVGSKKNFLYGLGLGVVALAATALLTVQYWGHHFLPDADTPPEIPLLNESGLETEEAYKNLVNFFEKNQVSGELIDRYDLLREFYESGGHISMDKEGVSASGDKASKFISWVNDLISYGIDEIEAEGEKPKLPVGFELE